MSALSGDASNSVGHTVGRLISSMIDFAWAAFIFLQSSAKRTISVTASRIHGRKLTWEWGKASAAFHKAPLTRESSVYARRSPRCFIRARLSFEVAGKTGRGWGRICDILWSFMTPPSNVKILGNFIKRFSWFGWGSNCSNANTFARRKGKMWLRFTRYVNKDLSEFILCVTFPKMTFSLTLLLGVTIHLNWFNNLCI